MKIEDKLLKRIQKDLVITEESYITGILYLLCYLFRELKIYMEKEGRFHGIVISYMSSIRDSYSRMGFQDIDEESESIYKKIMYLYKPIILFEYRKLCKRHVSEADSIISIIKRILGTIVSFEDYFNIKEVKTLDKIITKLFDNIRNRGKNDKMNSLVKSLRLYIDLGQIGNRELKDLSIEVEEKKQEKVEFEGTGIRLLDEDTNSKLTEVSWKEE